jgi:RNA polymerase sigma-70 factor (ECF subfamily)
VEDEKIIELFFARSESAISEVSKKYGGICTQTSFNITSDWCDAEECVNDSYLGMWNAIPPHRPNPLLAFLLKIVRNLSINRYNQKITQKRKSNYDLCLDELSNIVSSTVSVEDEVAVSELSGMIDMFLDSLSETNRMIFVRRYWFMDSYSNLSLITGMNEGTIRTRLSRLRTQLKIFLEERGGNV